MKKFLIAILILISMNSKAQITLDTTIVPIDGWGFDVYPVQISPTETKYLFADTITNTFSLYNMDFTPFMTNIAVPEPFASWTFQVIYVSRSLFDCDTSNIEYVYEASLGNNNHPFYIMRTDGTQLFRLDSAIGHYGVGGIMGGSHVMMPIENTSAGAKLYLHHASVGGGQAVNIYSLCGNLPEEVFDLTHLSQSFVKIFPNPTANILTFQVILPDNVNECELVIVDNNAREIKREKIGLGYDKHIIDVSNFSSGTYYYSLCTKNKAYQSGKFIINK